MLNRSEINIMLMLRNRGDNPFSQLPIDLIREISEVGQSPGSDFDRAIKHTARGELSQLKSILEKASLMEDKSKLKELLLSPGTATTRCGLLVTYKTLLECALGEGDREMIAMIKSFFPMLENGKEEMEKQLERYRPAIEALKNQKPDNLAWLFNIIKESSARDVQAELAEGDKYDTSYHSELRTALNKFRKQKLDPKVRVITKPRMHCNYQNLFHAYYMFNSSFDKLKEWDDVKKDYNYDKCRLAAQQVIGLIQLVELPAFERYLMARRNQFGMESAGMKKEIVRILDYEFTSGSFPDFDASLMKSHSGFGFVSLSGFAYFLQQNDISLWNRWQEHFRIDENFILEKYKSLAELMPHSGPDLSSCVIA